MIFAQAQWQTPPCPVGVILVLWLICCATLGCISTCCATSDGFLIPSSCSTSGSTQCCCTQYPHIVPTRMPFSPAVRMLALALSAALPGFEPGQPPGYVPAQQPAQGWSCLPAGTPLVWRPHNFHIHVQMVGLGSSSFLSNPLFNSLVTHQNEVKNQI